jgi:hypothetical protein
MKKHLTKCPETVDHYSNNWFNANGAIDRAGFVDPQNGGKVLGIDLYGVGTPVPEPGTLLIFSTGLLGLLLGRRRIRV